MFSINRLSPEESLLMSCVVLIFLIIVFFLIREINTWYWKINERLEVERKILSTLENLRDEIIPITSFIKKGHPFLQEDTPAKTEQKEKLHN